MGGLAYFVQWDSWRRNINFVSPPRSILGRKTTKNHLQFHTPDQSNGRGRHLVDHRVESPVDCECLPGVTNLTGQQPDKDLFIVDFSTFQFRLSKSRIKKIHVATGTTPKRFRSKLVSTLSGSYGHIKLSSRCKYHPSVFIVFHGNREHFGIWSSTPLRRLCGWRAL